MTEERLQQLKYPIGDFQKPEQITDTIIKHWINDIELFSVKLTECVKDLSSQELSWKYRPGGWNIKQLVHHCADSHMNAFIRFKLTLTEESPTIKPYLEHLWAALPDGQMEDIQLSLDLLSGLHHRWVVLLKSLTENDLKRSFVHPEHGRKIPLHENIGMYAWHCNHHLAHVKLAREASGKY